MSVCTVVAEPGIHTGPFKTDKRTRVSAGAVVKQRIRKHPESRDAMFYSACVLRATMNGDVLHKESITDHYSNIEDAIGKSHIMFGFTATCRGSQPFAAQPGFGIAVTTTSNYKSGIYQVSAQHFPETPQAPTAPAQASGCL